jgi:hypothetical protein
MNAVTDEDQLPWFRQFWPWFLILLPASVVVAGLTTVYIASEGADDLVVDEYYRDGLAINRQLEKKQRATTLGVQATLEFSKYSVALKLDGPESPATLHLLMSHPQEADLDFNIELHRVEPGFYAGTLPKPLSSRWHWTLEHRIEAGWRLDGSIDPAVPKNADSD